jgi:hypothetical protein
MLNSLVLKVQGNEEEEGGCEDGCEEDGRASCT